MSSISWLAIVENLLSLIFLRWCQYPTWMQSGMNASWDSVTFPSNCLRTSCFCVLYVNQSLPTAEIYRHSYRVISILFPVLSMLYPGISTEMSSVYERSFADDLATKVNYIQSLVTWSKSHPSDISQNNQSFSNQNTLSKLISNTILNFVRQTVA